MHPALLISAKDLRQRLRDRSAIIMGLIAPLGLALIFSSLFGDFGRGEVHFDLGVADADGGPVAQAFVSQVLPPIEAEGFATVTSFDDPGAARAAVADGDLAAAFLLPEGFSDAVLAGLPADLEVVGNVDQEIGTEVAASIADSFAATLRATQASVALVASERPGLDDAARSELAGRAARMAAPVVLGEVDAATRELDAVTYLSAGMAVFFLFFTVQFGVTSLLEERREGTLDRLLAAPIGRAAVYGGKGLTSLVLGLVSMTVLIVATQTLLGASWGDPVGVALLVVAGVVSAVAIMAVVATIARTAEQANVWQSIIAVVLGMLGGAFFPIGQASSWLANLSLITPHQWFLRGLAELQGGAVPADVFPHVAAILAFAVVGFGIAGVRLRGEGLR